MTPLLMRRLYKAHLALYGTAVALGLAYMVFPIVAGFWLSFSTVSALERVIAPWPIGVGIGLAFYKVREARQALKADRWTRYLPATVELIEKGELMWTMCVTRNDGTHMIVDVPSGYTPDSDGAMLILDLCSPEIPERFPKEYEMLKDSAMDWGLAHLLRQEADKEAE